MRIPGRAWIVALAALLAEFVGGIALASTPCNQAVYAVDPAMANTICIGILGEACGQVVPVSDTLVQAVSFYGPPDVAGSQGGSLWVTRVDATGMPQTASIVYGGAGFVIAAGDGVSPAHYDFEFDPPIALPGVGTYFFALKSDCLLDAAVEAVQTPAHGGGAWGTGRLCAYGLGSLSYGGADPSMNLAMRIVFCAAGATPTVRGSWGRVKAIYR